MTYKTKITRKAVFLAARLVEAADSEAVKADPKTQLQNCIRMAISMTAHKRRVVRAADIREAIASAIPHWVPPAGADSKTLTLYLNKVADRLEDRG